MKIEDYIPHGKDNAISRTQLQRLTGLPDRCIRSQIKTANRRMLEKGEAILSSASARGYWRTDSIAEMSAYLLESEHRTKTQYINDAPIRALVAKADQNAVVHVRSYTRRVVKRQQMPGQMQIGGG